MCCFIEIIYALHPYVFDFWILKFVFYISNSVFYTVQSVAFLYLPYRFINLVFSCDCLRFLKKGRFPRPTAIRPGAPLQSAKALGIAASPGFHTLKQSHGPDTVVSVCSPFSEKTWKDNMYVDSWKTSGQKGYILF